MVLLFCWLLSYIHRYLLYQRASIQFVCRSDTIMLLGHYGQWTFLVRPLARYIVGLRCTTLLGVKIFVWRLQRSVNIFFQKREIKLNFSLNEKKVKCSRGEFIFGRLLLEGMDVSFFFTPHSLVNLSIHYLLIYLFKDFFSYSRTNQ